MAGGENLATNITESEKIRIASDFLVSAPPGEFNEVFNSVRMLLNNDILLREGCAPVFARYNKEQFVTVTLEGVEKPTLITAYNDLGNGRFADEAAGKSFKYDHLRKEASDVQELVSGDAKMEQWRSALQSELDAYVDDHFQRNGVGCVFTRGAGGKVMICIESHQFQPANFCNGRWRSEWTVPVESSGSHDIHGHVKVQGEASKTAKEILRAIGEEEATYQNAVQENYATMSDQTFKVLRRQLPVTRSKMDWLKLQSYRIAQDMRPQ